MFLIRGNQVLAFGIGLVVGSSSSCGTHRDTVTCYEVAELPPYDPETHEFRICDEPTPIDRKYPEFEDTELIALRLEGQDECPMCPWELDELFWQAFLERVEDQGLDEGEDPDCLNQGYAIEKACLFPPLDDSTCIYHALVASHCALGPDYTPVRPSP